ncbi:MAG: protein kinase domain-containing protein [Gemmatimonas sp.]
MYLARQHSDGRAVAIKILRDELVTEISTERFLREIRVTTRLQHPNIVPVLGSGEYDDRPFLVLPHMDGGTLRERFEREKQLPLAEVISIGKTIAEALQFAHERKLLHRDVKPENILFADGQACLADFGRLAPRHLYMPRPLRVCRPTVPPELEAAIERALASPASLWSSRRPADPRPHWIFPRGPAPNCGHVPRGSDAVERSDKCGGWHHRGSHRPTRRRASLPLSNRRRVSI